MFKRKSTLIGKCIFLQLLKKIGRGEAQRPTEAREKERKGERESNPENLSFIMALVDTSKRENGMEEEQNLK